MRVAFFFTFLFCSIAGIAQHSIITDDAIVRAYSKATLVQQQNNLNANSNTAAADSDNLLIKVKTENIAAFKKRYQGYIKRQLSSNWFVTAPAHSIENDTLIISYYISNNNWKLSPALLTTKDQLPPTKEFVFLMEVNDSIAFRQYITATAGKGARVLYTYNKKLFRVKTSMAVVLNELADKSYVQSIAISPDNPKEETVINEYDNSVNAINLFFAKYSAINGAGLTVSVKENLFDTNDIDFKGRYQPTPSVSSSVTTHATTMATLIGGGGNSFYTAKGIVPASRTTSSDFANLLPDDNSIYQQYGISVQNHSYGTDVDNIYGSDAAAFDQCMLDNPSLVDIFSAGNSGNLAPSQGQYANITGFANITGSFKQAKNIITVGSVDSFYRVPLLSSKGPAYDGRIKPELVAYGNDGSSGAAAITSGTALAVQHAYATLHHDSLPPNALVKAVLINSADDVENLGPDFISGYGNVNTYRAASDVLSGDYFSGAVVQDETKSFTIHLPAQVSKLKVTLVWNDAPAQTNAFTALVNDLDLQLENAVTHTLYLPWVLNSAADSTALSALAIRKRDSLNVVEQVTLDNPAAGDYIIHVKGYDIPTASQSFYLVYQMDTADSFSFIAPSANDNFSPVNNNTFRWNSTYTATTGKLEYSTDKGLSWRPISTNIDLSKRYYSWMAPDTFATALARFTIGNKQYTTDTFTLSRQLYLQVAFNCEDSALIYWNKAPGISKYQVYRLGAKYLEPFAIVNDTGFLIHNNINSPENFASQYIAVAPVISNFTAEKSYTYNFTTQGTGCFINNFLADLTDNNSVQMQVFLGTVLHVNNVQLQRQTANGWQTITTVQPVVNTYLTYVYDSLRNGINNYRAVVTLDNNSTVTGSTASVYYFKNAPFIVFPNPVARSGGFTVLSQNVDNTNILLLYDAMGRKVLQRPINTATKRIALQTLAKGVYFIVVLNENQPVFKSKLIVE